MTTEGASRAPRQRPTSAVANPHRDRRGTHSGGCRLTVAQLASASADVVPLAATAGCGKSPTLTSGTHSIQSSGQNRQLHPAPARQLQQQQPVPADLRVPLAGRQHARTSPRAGVTGLPGRTTGCRSSRTTRRSSSHRNGLGNGWANSGGQDVTLVDDIMRRIEADLCVETTQRFALGFSFGGGMSYAWRARAPTPSGRSPSTPARRSAGAAAAASRSRTSESTGSPTTSSPSRTGARCGTRFVANNGCTNQSPREPAPGSAHITTTYSGCRAGYPVQWAAFDGGHGPGPVDGRRRERRQDLDQGRGVEVLRAVRGHHPDADADIEPVPDPDADSHFEPDVVPVAERRFGPVPGRQRRQRRPTAPR